jgi:hypothetical protein
MTTVPYRVPSAVGLQVFDCLVLCVRDGMCGIYSQDSHTRCLTYTEPRSCVESGQKSLWYVTCMQSTVRLMSLLPCCFGLALGKTPGSGIDRRDDVVV